eukprot:51087-Hanusia_phi.AAC.1
MPQQGHEADVPLETARSSIPDPRIDNVSEVQSVSLTCPFSPQRTGALERSVQSGVAHMYSYHPSIENLSEVPASSFVPPSPSIRTGKPGLLRSLRTELFHFFLSYRVRTEEGMIEGLYDKIVRMASEEKPLPFGAKGTWPRCARSPGPEMLYNRVKGFLDKRCLIDGKDWEASFVLGLAHSMLFVPLLSFYEEVDEESGGKVFRGSLGELVGLDQRDRVDNVLLEYIIAIEWCRKEGTHLQSIYPILLGKRREDGSFEEFPWSGIRMLPEKPAMQTNERAAMILSMLGVDEKQIQSMKQRTVKQTVEMILKHQACKPSDMASEHQFNEFCAGKILDVILRDIELLQLDPNEIAFKYPGGSEILQWLQERSLLGTAPTLFRHHIDSLKKAANLTDNDLRDIFTSEQDQQALPTFIKGQEVSLRMAIADLRKQKRSDPYSQRLLDFKDSKTAIGTAVWTTNAIEIVMSKLQGQYMFTVLAFVGLIPAYFLFSNNGLTVWQSRYYGVILWAKVVFYFPFWISNSVILLKSVYEAKYVRPHKARSTLEKHVLRWNYMFLLGILAEVAQILAGQHQAGWTVRDTFSYNGIAFQLVMYLPAILTISLTFKYREEYWVPAWLLVAFVLATVYSYFWREYPLYFTMCCFMIAFSSVLFIYFVIIRIRTISEARHKLGQNVKRYVEEWELCLQATNNTEDASESCSLQQDTGNNSRRGSSGYMNMRRLYPDSIVGPLDTRGALQTLWELTSAVEEELAQQYRSSEARVSLWKWFLQDRNNGFGRFRSKAGGAKYGKVRQRSKDLDQLYEQANTINSALHDLFDDLLAPLHSSACSTQGDAGRYPLLVCGPVKQPQRAIEKCVRSYRRDVGCLTDLVRCTVVADNVEQLLAVLCEIRERSVVGMEPVEQVEECHWSVPPPSSPLCNQVPSLSLSDSSSPSRGQKFLGWLVSSKREEKTSQEEQQQLMHSPKTEQRGSKERWFRMTQVKNRLHPSSHFFNPMTGYRDLSLNLEVGWTFDSGSVVFLPVEDWEQHAAESYIVEVQVRGGTRMRLRLTDWLRSTCAGSMR